jgi:subtilase family serine protease
MQKVVPVANALRSVRQRRWCRTAFRLLLGVQIALLITIALPASAQQLTILPGNVALLPQSATDLGPLPASTQLQNLTLVLSPTAQQNTALSQFLSALQTPSSPQFQQWLTPQQFASQFGVTSSQVQQAQAWLVSQGFTVNATAVSGQWIQFSGTAAQVESAFGISLEAYSVNGVSGYANLISPSVPNSLASFVSGVVGLSTLAPGASVSSESSSPIIQAAYNSGSGWLLLSQFSALYDLLPLQSAGVNGAGEQIAVTGMELVSNSDISAYRTAAGLSALNFQLDGTMPTQSGSGIATAELELAGSVAPAAQLFYFGAPTELQAAQSVVDQDTAAILLLSRSGCEATYSASEVTAYQQMSEQAAAEGITVIAPTGNSGPAACDAGATSATNGPAVAFPASLPQVIAVGGTSVANNTTSAWTNLTNSTTSVLAGGGGPSALFPKPSWQVTTPSDSFRDLPDISFAANLPYPVCVAGSCSSGFSGPNGIATGIVGTNAASASFAGVVALLDQKVGASGRLGNLAPSLYSIAATQPAAIYDITSGSNAVPCSQNCVIPSADLPAVAVSRAQPNSSSPSNSDLAYDAYSGYDLATGLGSINANALLQVFPRLTTPTVGVGFSAYAVPYGTSFTVTATLNPTTATGTVEFIDQNTSVDLGTVNVASGVASLLLPDTLPAGSLPIEAEYSGDGSDNANTGFGTDSIVPATSTTAVSFSSNSIAPGASLTVTATVTPSVATGNVTFNDSVSGSLGSANLSGGTAVVTTTALTAPGAHTVTATYAGDTNNATSNGSNTVTVTSRTTTTTLNLSSSSVTYGSSVTMTATINSSSATGTVTFTDSLGNALGTGSVSGGVATFTATTLQAGSHTITAAYGGDSNDLASSGTATVAVTKANSSTSVQLSSASIAYGTNLTITVSITPNLATGTVAFTDSVAGSLGSINLSSGVAQLNTTKLGAGTHTITANYSGDVNDAASSGTATLTVTQLSPTVSVTATPSTVVYGNNVVLTATLNSLTATGTVTFTDSVIGAIATVTVTAGTATTTTSALPVGVHTITAAYSGDTNDAAASGTTSVTVTKGSTICTLTITPSPSIVNFASTFTATISNAGPGTGPFTFTGTVTFFSGSTMLGSATVANNQAILSYTYTAIGNYNVYAVYSGDQNWNSSTSSVVSLVVQGVPTIATTYSSTSTVLAGANVILTTTIGPTPAYSSLVTSFPTGSVTYYDSYNGSFNILGSASLVQSGLYTSSTTFQNKFFLPGIHVITAVYGGSSNFAAATSNTFDLTVQDFSMTANPTTGSVSRGSSTATVITISSLFGFSGTVALSCTPPPSTYTSCTITNSSIVGSGVTTVVFATNVPTASSVDAIGTQSRGDIPRSIAPASKSTALSALALALLVGIFRPRRYKMFTRLIVLLFAVALLGLASIGLSGCTQVSNVGVVSGSAGVTPLGTQSFTITAVATNGVTEDSHTLTYEVAVQ